MQPREKLLKYGPKKLEWWELVATILWSGIKGMSVFALAKKVHKMIEEKRENLSIEDLSSIKWIGTVKAMQIISTFELAERYFVRDAVRIESSGDVLREIKDYRDKKQEYLICLTIDGANRLINTRVVTIWLIDQSLIHPREVFAGAIEDRANGIILVHNHPSGICKPSGADTAVTTKIQKAGEIIGIKLIDHIIVTKEEYFSFRESELL